MARQIYTPQRGEGQLRKRENELIQPDGPRFDPTQSQAISQRAGGFLDELDNSLAQNGASAPGNEPLQPEKNPGSGISESAARDAKNRRISQAEIRAARQTSKRGSLANQEDSIKFPSVDNLYKIARERRQATGKRGILIGLGAGGGILSIVAGFSFLLPFKLPGIMDTIMRDGEKRVEHVVEKRAERVMLRYILNGSSAALKNDAVIATGNPIGDLFANLRTSKFEDRLLAKHGLSFQPGPNKTVTLVSNGKSLGDAKNPDDILKILDKGQAGKSLTRADLKIIVREDIPFWRFFKRIKYKNWLANKYHIKRFGTRERKTDESDEDFKKTVRQDEIDKVDDGMLQNMDDFVNCVDTGDANCGELDKTGTSDSIDEAAKGVAAESKNIAETTTEKITKSLTERIVEKMLGKSAALAIPYVNVIDMAARVDHWLANELENQTLLKKHAEYMKRAYSVLFATWAGYSEQTKAGGMPMATAGMLADQMNGFEGAAGYNLIDSGKATGSTLTGMKSVGEDLSLPEFAKLPGVLYGSVGLVPRAPIIAWYYTVSQVFDAVGKVAGDAISWIVQHTPAKVLANQLGKFASDILKNLLDLIGMSVDPLSIGESLWSMVHAGSVSSSNDFCASMGCRKLSFSQAKAQDAELRQSRIADMQNESLYERLVDLNNSDSLASTLVANIPTQNNNPFASFAMLSANVVARAPASFANILSTPAFADSPTTTAESLYHINTYGGLDDDLNQDVAPETSSSTSTCPENSDNSFNRCNIDKYVVESANCSLVQCPDMNQVGDQAAGAGGGTSNDGSISGNTQELAKKIMDLKKQGIVTFEDGNSDGAYQDVYRTSNGQPSEGCGRGPVSLKPAMLQAIVHAATKYKFRINAMVSDHDCDKYQHPKGKAVDIGLVDGQTAITSDSLAKYREFAIFMSQGMPGGGIGQSQCLGTLQLANGVTQFPDNCNHLHVEVP